MTIPDLNVLLYAANSESAHHKEAKQWLDQVANQETEEIGLPWAVLLGFLRITTSARVFPRPLTIKEALAWIRGLLDNPAVHALDPGSSHLGILGHLLLGSGAGGNLTTDAHISALALEYDATVATGDRDFLRFPGVKVEVLF